MHRFLPALLGALLVGCGPDPVTACEDFLAANSACAAEAYGGTSPFGDSTGLGGGLTCESVYGDVDGSAAKAAEEAFTCYAETFDNGDCSTPEGYMQLNEDICNCESALPGQCTQFTTSR